jgi:polyisoprenoid-binding protein YceI
MVTGRLTIHGETRPTTFTVVRRNGRFRGTVGLKQSDFGIQPISILGGTVRVKDELKIEFDVVARK